MNYNLIWFILLGILLGGYAVLDGFDLGVGILHPLARNDRERRITLNSIGPIWDGNEVWLITFGGALMAAFPEAYATIFSAFYVPFMALLLMLILRAVSLEFRSKVHHKAWRGFWDFAFFFASLVASFLFGVTIGNALIGIPLSERGIFTGNVLGLLGPFPLLVGALVVAMFAMHGSIYLHLKTEAEFQEHLHEWMWHTWGFFVVLYILASFYALINLPHAIDNFRRFPWAAGIAVLNVLAVANIPRAIYHGRPLQAFVSSAITILALVTLFGLSLFPNLVASSSDPRHSLTICHAASSPRTLKIMLIIAAIGMPFVLSYTVAIYWTFRGKVKFEEQPHAY